MVGDRKIEVKLGGDLIYFNADNFIEDYRRVVAWMKDARLEKVVFNN